MLFCVRFYLTRNLGQAAAVKVRLSGIRKDKPDHAVKPGDVVTQGKGPIYWP